MKRDAQIDIPKGQSVSRSPAETRLIGERIGRALRGGEMILLTGELGAGKTALVRGMAHALGVRSWRGSPSFTLVNEYPTSPRLVHIDLYRLSRGEVEDMGLEEYAAEDSAVVVEWANRADEYLKSLACGPVWRVELAETGPDERAVSVEIAG